MRVACLQRLDDVNTVERITIVNPPTGLVRVTVIGTSITETNTQSFSLVASGVMDSTECPTTPELGETFCPNDCSGNGQCDAISALCKCFWPYHTPDCGVEMVILENLVPFDIRLSSRK